MKILGLNARATRNCGDLASSPLLYFKFPGHRVHIDHLETPPRDWKPDLVIYGGGSIIDDINVVPWGCPMVAWGVGHTVRRAPWDDAMNKAHMRARAMFELYFPRDRVPCCGEDWVPDASCMHRVFDDPGDPVHELVKYSAERRVDCSQGPEPHMSNHDGTIEEAVRFLASGRTIITSSYHGAYWGRLLGRRVHVIRWGSKFDYLPDLDLEQCREMNRRVYARVMERFRL